MHECMYYHTPTKNCNAVYMLKSCDAIILSILCLLHSGKNIICANTVSACNISQLSLVKSEMICLLYITYKMFNCCISF